MNLPTAIDRAIEAGLTIKSCGYELDTAPEAFGYFHEFHGDALQDFDQCKASYDREGYLYIKGFGIAQELWGFVRS